VNLQLTTVALYNATPFVTTKMEHKHIIVVLIACQQNKINTTIKITSVCDGDAWSVGGGRGWLAGDTDGLAGDR